MHKELIIKPSNMTDAQLIEYMKAVKHNRRHWEKRRRKVFAVSEGWPKWWHRLVFINGIGHYSWAV